MENKKLNPLLVACGIVKIASTLAVCIFPAFLFCSKYYDRFYGTYLPDFDEYSLFTISEDIYPDYLVYVFAVIILAGAFASAILNIKGSNAKLACIFSWCSSVMLLLEYIMLEQKIILISAMDRYEVIVTALGWIALAVSACCAVISTIAFTKPDLFKKAQ